MLRRILLIFAGLILVLSTFAAAPNDKSAEAARLNNVGEAYMNQQLFEKGLKSFTDAAALDPQLSIATINKGIALVNNGKVDEARKILEDAAKANPKDPHVWYNLGLLYKNSSDSQAAVDAFHKVTEIDPNDADAWYFLGTSYSQLKQFPQAIEALQHAVKLNQFHASAEFGLSRAYQQSGDSATAREHLKRFQYITQNKLGSAITLAYGEQGKYSRVESSPGVVEKVLPQISVKFVDATETAGLKASPIAGTDDLLSFLGPGACFLDYDGDGKPDLLLTDNGPQGGVTLYHNAGNGKFEDVTKKAGLDPAMHAIGCTAGDYDNDGAPDLALSLNGRVLLLHNEKDGTFKDVTAASGIKSDGLNTGVTFIDYDHDGDLDLYVSKYRDGAFAPKKPFNTATEAISGGRNMMFRN
ncbi:MAG TPA: tetratricopeptide repeat protein, partial [Terriglobales bacterium]|nr:tetratricopeptide repeat protein [Terriglobales bacterium]